MDQKGFVGTLFDLSFSSFVTIKLIRILYVLAIIGVALMALGTLVGGLFTEGIAAKLGGIVMAPIVFVVGLLLARVYMELLMVIFRIAENTTVIAGHVTAKHEASAQAPAVAPADPTYGTPTTQ